MWVELSKRVVETIQSAARKLTGHERRQFQAETARQYCAGNPRQAERVFGWGRDAVNTGLHELRTGIRCCDSFSVRGRHQTEQKHPEIAQQIHALVEPESQADPKFQTPLAYTRMTAKAVREQLAAKAKTDGTEPHIPPERSLYRILNRLGYRLRRVRKTKPKKKDSRDRRHLRPPEAGAHASDPRAGNAAHFAGHQSQTEDRPILARRRVARTASGAGRRP